MTRTTATVLAAIFLAVVATSLRAQQTDKEKELAKQKAAADKAREADARAQNFSNLKQIGIAVHEFYDKQQTLPRHAIYSKDGKTPLLSWRVALLPYLDEKALFKDFKLDEPWNSPHNRRLIAKMPKVYAPVVSGKAGAGKTFYQVITGPDTLFDGTKKMKLTDIRDGTSNTILAIEGKNAVTWTAPEDVPLPRGKGRLPAIGGQFKDSIAVLFGDGSVHTIRPDPPVEVLRAVISPAGGEVVDPQKLER